MLRGVGVSVGRSTSIGAVVPRKATHSRVFRREKLDPAIATHRLPTSREEGGWEDLTTG
jgi:hypothetical protein